MSAADCVQDAAVGPCALVIFGAKGDLTKRKLIPALLNLAGDGLLPQEFAVIGFGRGDITDDAWRARMREDIQEFSTGAVDGRVWDWLESRLSFVNGDFEDPEAFVRLAAELRRVESERNTGGNVLNYLAIAPRFFGEVVRRLAEAGALPRGEEPWHRVVVEKPFGRDLESARELNDELRSVLSERQIYRIDHYLGKETVQNLLVFRFANGIFEPIWNRQYVDHVQISVAETLGVEKRGGYYDNAGALRDMVPNHVFQLISLVAMEPPISFEADAVRDEQAKVIRAIQSMTAQEVLSRTVRGQYAGGRAGGRDLADYRGEEQVAENSATETFVAMRLGVDNWRWKHVPFYLRVGKALPKRTTEIHVQFKRPPLTLFRDTPIERLAPNVLTVNVQPDEGIHLGFGAKVPGATMCIETVDMNFTYAEHFGSKPATGYERLLYDAMLGDQTLFQRADMVEGAWAVVDPILDVWGALPPRDFPNYRAGTWGPNEADELLGKDGRRWLPTGE